MTTPYNSILVCNATLTLASPISNTNKSELHTVAPLFNTANDTTITIPLFKMYDYEQFIVQLVKLRDMFKASKNKLNTNIIGVLYDRDDDNKTTMVKIKTTNKEIKHIIGKIKVSFSDKDDEDKPKALTLEEKLNLIKEWHVEHPEEVPNTKTVHKNFKVGKFIEKSEKDAKLKMDIDTIFQN